MVWEQDLPDDLKEEYDVGDEYSNFMIVKHDDTIISVTTDYMEPEDATFTRDLKWVSELLREVYELGKLEQSG